eukprot:Em0003g342a
MKCGKDRLSLLTLFLLAPLLSEALHDSIPGEYIVILNQQLSSKNVTDHLTVARKLITEYGNGSSLTAVYGVGKFNGYAAKLNDKLRDLLRSMPEVAYVEYNQKVHTMQSCTLQTGATWGIVRTTSRNLPTVSDYSYGPTDGTDVNVYIIDTGIQTSHPDFGGRAIWGIDFVDDPSPMADRNGHGTHVAGVFTLMPWTQLVPCSDVLVAMISLFYAYVRTVQVVALRWTVMSNTLCNVIRGINWVAGQHRAGKKSVANVTVMASDSTDKFATFSNYGTCAHIIAPAGVVAKYLSSQSTVPTPASVKAWLTSKQMTAVVKKKIVEKLARFTKDLKPSDISLSFLTGKAVLQKIELNADFLTEIFHLPPCLQISRVVCDLIKADVPFTSLGTNPIQIMINKVEVEVASCDGVTPRTKQFNDLKLGNSHNSPSTYGYVDKVVDGMKVSIHAVVLRFKDPTFEGSLEVSNVVIQSTTPQWKVSSHLKDTRFKNEEEDYVIVYKMCSWDSVKMEGVSLPNTGQDKLRLVSQETFVRLALKRRISDCSVVHSRVSIHLGDLLCILTQSQLRATSLLIQRLTESSLHMEEEEEEEEKEGKKASSNTKNHPKAQKQSTPHPSIPATPHPGLPGWQAQPLPLPGHPGLLPPQNAGRMNIVFERVMLDMYPDQAARSGHHHWNRANDLIKSNVKWSAEMLGAASKGRDEGVERDVFVSLGDLREMGVVLRCAEFAINAVRKKVLPLITSDKATFKIPDDDDNPAITDGDHIVQLPQGIRLESFWGSIPPPHGSIPPPQGSIPPSHGSIPPPHGSIPPPHGSIPPSHGSIPPSHGSIPPPHPYLHHMAPYLHYVLKPLFTMHVVRPAVPRPNAYIYMSPIHVNVHQESILWLAEFIHGVIATVNVDLAKTAVEEGNAYLKSRKSTLTVAEQKQVGVDLKFRLLFSKITLPIPDVRTDGRPKALQIETSSIEISNCALCKVVEDKSFRVAMEWLRKGWVFKTHFSKEFPHFAGDFEPFCAGLSTVLRNHFPDKSHPQASLHSDARRKLDLMSVEVWQVETACVSVSFPESYSHDATLRPKQFPLHVTLERLQFLFLLDVKESFRNFQSTLIQLLTLGNRSSLSPSGNRSPLSEPNISNPSTTTFSITTATSTSTTDTTTTDTNTTDTMYTFTDTTTDTITTKGNDSVEQRSNAAASETEMFMELDSKAKEDSAPLRRPSSMTSLLASGDNSQAASSPFGSTANLSAQHEGQDDEERPGDLHPLSEDTISVADSSSIPPPQGSIPPSQGSIPPSQGSIPPSQGSIPPSQGSIPPSQGSIPPSQGSIPPSQGSIAPSQVSIAPSQVSIAPLYGSIPPPQGSIAPSQGSIPPSQTFISPPQTFASPSKTSIPPVIAPAIAPASTHVSSTSTAQVTKATTGTHPTPTLATPMPPAPWTTNFYPCFHINANSSSITILLLSPSASQ